MLKKLINYNDLDGNPQSEIFWFNLNAAEIATLSFVTVGGDGLDKMLEKIIAEGDVGKIVQMFTEVVSRAYGVRSEDGKRFIKSPQLFEEFSQTPAFDALIMEMITNAAAGGEFFNGILPANMAEVNANLQNQADVVELPQPEQDAEPWLAEDRDPTKEELRAMNKSQMVVALQHKRRRQDQDDELAKMRAELAGE